MAVKLIVFILSVASIGVMILLIVSLWHGEWAHAAALFMVELLIRPFLKPLFERAYGRKI